MDERPSEPEAPPVKPRGTTVEELLRHITPRVWVTPAVAILCVAGFAFELYRGAALQDPTGNQLLAAGGDFGPSFANGEWWRVITHMFLHAGPVHLAFNMWAFYSVGPLTERIFGNKSFLALYLLSGIGGALASLTFTPFVVSVGASGAIFGVYGALLAFVILHRGVFPVEYLAQQRNGIIGFIGYNVVFTMARGHDGIDIAAHAGGFLTGALLGAALGRDMLNPSAHLWRRLSGALGVTALLGFAAFTVRTRLLKLPEIEAERTETAAIAHLVAKEYEQAIASFSRVLVLRGSQNTHAARFNRGLAYLESDKLELAQDDFKAANDLEANASTHGLLCEVGVMLARTDKEIAPVISHCTAALAVEREPARRAQLLSMRARAYGIIDGKLPEVVADATAALALDENAPNARVRRAHARLLLGAVVEAGDDCDVAVRDPAVSVYGLVVCAKVAHKQNQASAERALLARALAQEPTHPNALFARAWLNEQEGRLADAVADYTTVVRTEPTNTTALNNRAWVEVELGDFAAARADADAAVAQASAQGEVSALYHGTQCFALTGLGERAAARAACARALEIKPDNLFDRGMLAFLDGRNGDARRDWKKAGDIDPVNARELKAWLAKLPR